MTQFFDAGHARPETTVRPKFIARRPLLAIAPLTLAVVFANQVLAQEALQANAIVVSAPEITAPVTTRVNLDETPVLQSATDGATVLAQIPGFAAIGNGGTNGDPTFRGMFGSRLAILTSGAQMAGACPNRMDNPSAYINPYSYDEVEIVKGPQTVLWGPGASAATVRFERAREDFSDKHYRLDASALVGSNGRFDRYLNGAVGNEQGYWRLEANASEADDYQDGNGDLVPSEWDKWNTSTAIGWTPDQDTLLELEVSRADGESKYAGRTMDGTKFLRETAALRFEKQNLSDNWSKLEAQLNYGYADHVMDNFTLRQPPMMPMAMELDRRTRSGRVASTWDWSDYSIIVGLDAKEEEHRRGLNMAMTMLDYSSEQVGAFSELTWFINDTQQLVSGIRFDRVSATDEMMNTATAGQERSDNLVSGFVRLESDLTSLPATTYIGLGYAQRFPDYWEIKPSNGSLSGAVNAFAGVQPEKTTQIDAGINYQHQDLSWWLSGYAGVVNDYILFDYSNATQVGNVDGYIAGAEAGARYQLSGNWSANGSLAYAWGDNRDSDEALPQIAPLEAKFGLTYEQQAWTLNSVLRMVAKQDRVAIDQGNVVGYDFAESASFATLDLNGKYRMNDVVTLRAGVDNLFNRAYSEHLNKAGSSAFDYPADTAFNEPGRTVWASVNASF
ncbi:Hemin receptor precursor [Marinomonas aquimarina]|uniref:Hemin receptor n=1 Tax=Marinomonas aquimarina TaxID=295068 RepID=A0A1A8TJX3_9GAMM|nr:TonB-dependent copper receptor [Marinomonas aquimarina]SBS33797.1 Hemin receptor precursor [Marinomonas aquimarina]